MKKNLKWIVFSISLLVFIILSFLVVMKKDIYLDSFIYNFISRYICDNLTFNVKYLTDLGGVFIVVLITIFALIFIKNKRYSIYMSLNLIIITIFQFVLKFIFSRSRPIDINLIDEKGYSFPSGHSLTAMAFYGFIIYLIFISKLPKKSKTIFVTLFSFIIFVVGLSRVYLGVHFFTDVIGGFTFSLSYLIAYISIIKGKLKRDL